MRRIPVLDARGVASPAAFAATSLPAETGALLAAARRSYGATALRLGDALSRRWLVRNATSLGGEIAAVGAVVGAPGAHLLNLSFEWGCSCGVAAQAAPVMLRTLDWSLDGLGETLCVIRQRGPAGDWCNIGWPGFAGAITALAPGRFALALNQPPLPATRVGTRLRERGLPRAALLAEWLAARPAAWRSRDLPPAHLLRLVCDTAPDFATALARLRHAPIAAAATFTLAGTRPGEAAVIERRPDRAALRQGEAVAAANHWASLDLPGAPRWRLSAERQAAMDAVLRDMPEGLAWLEPPLLNPGTRLAATLHPAAGRLTLAAFEGERQVSEVLDLG